MRVAVVVIAALLALAAAEGGFQPVAAPSSKTLPAEARDATVVAEADSSAGHVTFSDPPAQAEARDSGAGIGAHPSGGGFAGSHSDGGYVEGHHAGGGGYGPALDSYSGYGGSVSGGHSAGYDSGYGGGYDSGYGGSYGGGYGGGSQGYVQQGGYAGGYSDYAHGGGYGGYGGYEEVIVEEKPWYEKYINRYKFPIFIPKINFVTVDSSILSRIPPAKGDKGGGYGSQIGNYFKGFFGGGKGKGKGKGGKGKGGKEETVIVNHHHYYDEGYGHGQKGYAPAPSYGPPPAPSYGAPPAPSYGAPPAAGYGAPHDPAPGYGAPPASGYGAPTYDSTHH